MNKLVPSLLSIYLNNYFDHSFEYASEIIDLSLEKNSFIRKGS